MEALESGWWLSATAEEVYLFWEGVGAILVRDGCEIVVDPLPGVQAWVLRLVILGWAFAALLHQRGLLTLHASAVAVAGGVVAFLGEKGRGKSTIAAALHARGHGIVADDMTAAQVNTSRPPMVFPGFPQLRLWPEAAAALGDDPEALSLIHPRLEKRARRSVQGFSSTPLPLRCIYVLEEGKIQEIKPVQPTEALVELKRNSYSPQLQQSVGEAWHFFQCAGVVKNVSIRSLRRPRSLPALSDLARLVEEDLFQSLERSPGGSHSP